MILIIDMNFKPLSSLEFVEPLKTIVKKFDDCETKHYTDTIELEKYDKVIISGTALKDNNYFKPELFKWLIDFQHPVLGICAGMEILGILFGSKLIKCKEIGMQKITTIRENLLFSSDFNAYELHNFSLDPSEDFEVLSISENCIQAIKHKEKEFYGLMFHPEVRNKEIIHRFLSIPF